MGGWVCRKFLNTTHLIHLVKMPLKRRERSKRLIVNTAKKWCFMSSGHDGTLKQSCVKDVITSKFHFKWQSSSQNGPMFYMVEAQKLR